MLNGDYVAFIMQTEKKKGTKVAWNIALYRFD